MRTAPEREQRLRRYWDKHAAGYDREMGFFDRHLFADTRGWVCSRATGRTAEVPPVGRGCGARAVVPQGRAAAPEAGMSGGQTEIVGGMADGQGARPRWRRARSCALSRAGGCSEV